MNEEDPTGNYEQEPDMDRTGNAGLLAQLAEMPLSGPDGITEVTP